MTTINILRLVSRFTVVYSGLLHKVLENTSRAIKKNMFS
jgi:hypothetical protein